MRAGEEFVAIQPESRADGCVAVQRYLRKRAAAFAAVIDAASRHF
jgi:hypothetical protein